MGDLIRFAFTPFNNSHPDSYLIMTTLIYFDGYYPLSAKVVPNYYLIDNINEIIK